MRPPTELDWRRVAVVGISGAGKSTLSRDLARLLQAPRIELDELFWDRDWAPKAPADFRARVTQAVAGERWVSDGNYSSARDIIWPRATLLVWLNLPFHVVFWQTLRRTLVRAWRGDVLWHGNRETLARTFFSRESILWWVITNHGRRRREYLRMRRAGEWPQLPWIELRSRRDIRELLASLEYAGREVPAGRTEEAMP